MTKEKEEYDKQRRKMKAMVKLSKKESWEEFGKRIEMERKSNCFFYTEEFKKSRRNSYKYRRCIGKIVRDEKLIMKRRKEHYQALLIDQEDGQIDEEEDNIKT